MGARLEYVMQPIAFGFGTAIVALVGTKCGARQYRRAREIAWTNVARLGTLYLRIVGPAYVCFGPGLALFHVTQGVAAASRP